MVESCVGTLNGAGRGSLQASRSSQGFLAKSVAANQSEVNIDAGCQVNAAPTLTVSRSCGLRHAPFLPHSSFCVASHTTSQQSISIHSQCLSHVNMAERAWSVAPAFTPAATFEKFEGAPGESGRRWLRRFLYHFDNTTPSQLISLIDIHLAGAAAGWADGDEEVFELLSAEDSATDYTIKRFKELFSERFNVQRLPGANNTTEQPSRHAVVQSTSVPNANSQALVIGDNQSLKRGRNSEGEAEERATKKTCTELALRSPAAHDQAVTEKTQFFTPPYFKWENFYQTSHETVEQYGHRALDLFTATGGLDRTKKKQHFFPGQVEYLGRTITYFISGIRDVTLRRKIGYVAKKIKLKDLSLERLAATAHEYAQRQAQGIDFSDNDAERDFISKHGMETNAIDKEVRKSKANENREKQTMNMALPDQQGNGKGKGKGKGRGKENKKDLQESRAEVAPFAQYKLSDQAAVTFGSSSFGYDKNGNTSIRFRPSDIRPRESDAYESA